MTTLFYYSRFFGVKKGVVDQDLGDSLVVRVNNNPQIVKKSDIDSKRADDGGWWSSMDVWADKVVDEAESWADTLRKREADLDAEIAMLRKERADETAHAKRKAEEAREWRRNFKFDAATCCEKEETK